ncbi:hypothetical protein EPN18_04095 [bacterium]|nr:MAG: hypothetical protein EPN18_04095 [bacterium]
MLKKLVLIALMLFGALSCSGGTKNEEKPKTAGEIANKYVETLTTAQPKAKEAGKALERSNDEKIKAIEGQVK